MSKRTCYTADYTVEERGCCDRFWSKLLCDEDCAEDYTVGSTIGGEDSTFAGDSTVADSTLPGDSTAGGTYIFEARARRRVRPHDKYSLSQESKPYRVQVEDRSIGGMRQKSSRSHRSTKKTILDDLEDYTPKTPTTIYINTSSLCGSKRIFPPKDKRRPDRAKNNESSGNASRRSSQQDQHTVGSKSVTNGTDSVVAVPLAQGARGTSSVAENSGKASRSTNGRGEGRMSGNSNSKPPLHRESKKTDEARGEVEVKSEKVSPQADEERIEGKSHKKGTCNEPSVASSSRTSSRKRAKPPTGSRSSSSKETLSVTKPPLIPKSAKAEGVQGTVVDEEPPKSTKEDQVITEDGRAQKKGIVSHDSVERTVEEADKSGIQEDSEPPLEEPKVDVSTSPTSPEAAPPKPSDEDASQPMEEKIVDKKKSQLGKGTSDKERKKNAASGVGSVTSSSRRRDVSDMVSVASSTSKFRNFFRSNRDKQPKKSRSNVELNSKGHKGKANPPRSEQRHGNPKNSDGAARDQRQPVEELDQQSNEDLLKDNVPDARDDASIDSMQEDINKKRLVPPSDMSSSDVKEPKGRSRNEQQRSGKRDKYREPSDIESVGSSRLPKGFLRFGKSKHTRAETPTEYDDQPRKPRREASEEGRKERARRARRKKEDKYKVNDDDLWDRDEQQSRRSERDGRRGVSSERDPPRYHPQTEEYSGADDPVSAERGRYLEEWDNEEQPALRIHRPMHQRTRSGSSFQFSRSTRQDSFQHGDTTSVALEESDLHLDAKSLVSRLDLDLMDGTGSVQPMAALPASIRLDSGLSKGAKRLSRMNGGLSITSQRSTKGAGEIRAGALFL